MLAHPKEEFYDEYSAIDTQRGTDCFIRKYTFWGEYSEFEKCCKSQICDVQFFYS